MRRKRIAVAAIVGCALAVTACTTGHNEKLVAPPSSASSSSAVNMKDPEAVGAAFVTTATTWEPGKDATETAAALRAKKYMTSELYSQTQEPPNPGAPSIWNQAYAAKAVSHPTVKGVAIADAPADTSTTHYLAYRAAWKWLSKANNAPAPVNDTRVRTFYLTLTNQSDGGWLVSAYDTNDVANYSK